MKKFIILFSLLVIGQQSMAQFKIGPNIGIPVGDVSEIYKLQAGLDLYYLFGDDPDALLKFGATTGFINYFGDDVGGFSIDDAQFIPIAGVARIIILDTIVAGPDIGYAIGISDGNDGAFYWKLVAGIDLGNVLELTAFYHGIPVDGYSFGSVGAGLLFEF